MFKFKNAGKRIQVAARAFFVVEIIGAIIGAFAVAEGFGVGLLIFIGGVCAAYLNALFLHGFGLIVENSERQINASEPSINKDSIEKENHQRKPPRAELCDICGNNNAVMRIRIEDPSGLVEKRVCKECYYKTKKQ